MTRFSAHRFSVAWLSSALMLAATFCPTRVQAQLATASEESPEKDSVELRAARFLFSEGNSLTDEREHERALKALSISFDLYPAANTAVNIVGLLIDTKDYRSARAWLEFARTLPDLSDRARVVLVEFEEVIAKHQGRVKLELEDPSRYDVEIEDKPFAAEKLAKGVLLDPGRYYLEVQQQGMVTFGTNVEVRAGLETEVEYREHTIRRRQKTSAPPLAFAPPTRAAQPSSKGGDVSLFSVSAPSRATPLYDEPWFRALVATAATMTILSTALTIHEL